MKTVMHPFIWNVLLHDCNTRSVKVYNVLSMRREDYIKKLKKKCATKEEFIELLDKDLCHQFQSRSEYEMILYLENDRVYLGPPCGTFKEDRINITDCDTLDWPAFANDMLTKCTWHNKESSIDYAKFDIYDQIHFRFEEFMDFVWNYRHKYQRVKKENK